MVRVELRKESKVVVYKNRFVETGLEGIQVYISCEGITAWLATVFEIDELDDLFGDDIYPFEELLSERLSITEFDEVWNEIHQERSYINHRGQVIIVDKY